MPLLPDPQDPGTDAAGVDAAMDPAVSALRALILASQEFRLAVANRLGVGVTDTVAMSYLATDGPLGARDLAGRMGIATSSVTTVLDRLESAGLARREPLPGDRRGLTIVLTDYGREALGWTRQWMRNALNDLGAEHLGGATYMLDRLATSLREQIDELGSPETPVPESPIPRRR